MPSWRRPWYTVQLQILCRRQKNNPCLIGEAGVGKTAIAEGIAQRIAEGKVPARLQDKEIYLLDHRRPTCGGRSCSDSLNSASRACFLKSRPPAIGLVR